MMSYPRTLVGAMTGFMILVLSACSTPEPTPTAEPVVTETVETPKAEVADSLAVIGDSMSLAVAACDTAKACVEASWAVGTDPEVNSIAERLSAVTGKQPQTTAVARIGAGVAYAEQAVLSIRATKADIVLVLLGANDACAASTDDVTTPEEFDASYSELLSGVHNELPDAELVAYSVPDLLWLWQLGRDDPETVSLWGQSPSCRSLLADADSDEPEDVERRDAIDAVIDEYNASIQEACSLIEQCTFDDYAVHNVEFTAEDVSPLDHFHASLSGQATLAEAAWPAAEVALEKWDSRR
ncbi:GDSL-type esterase/lipase family protein [Microbacterium sp. R86528]|uniref:GDSL-type esterase/lipase family protein n=1 Tax=Microbacterium sp. R86528 TaxID=3093864 RepID=UPI0037C68FB3